jgi:hypothetical protein
VEKPEQAAPIDREGPDLQKLVAEHGGYDKITPEAWAKFDFDKAQWLDWVRQGGLHGQV